MTKPPVKSRFDNSGPAQSPIAPTLSSLLRKVVREHAKTLRVCLPARVETVLADYRVNVRPGFLETHAQAAAPTPMPLLPNVPVSMPHGQLYSIRYPVSVGDLGYVLIADRSIDSWLAGDGQPTDPVDARLHDLTDAIFVPGLLPDQQAQAAQDGSSDLVLKAGLAALRLQKAGTFSLSNGPAELVDLTQKLAADVAALTLYVMTAVDSVGKPITSPNSPSAAVSAATIANQLNTLKGS